jgi:superfamily II DNA or RNA helicase
MKIVKMDANSFWKGEAGVVGLVEDQAHTFKTKLYLKNGQVKDYSCTCEKGNSYRGICAHGEALFAYYKEYQAEMSKPLVHSSSQVHTMIREYTNQEVARILEEEEGSQVKLVPAVLLNGRDVHLEFKVGREKMYAVRDLGEFSDAVTMGAYVEYGKELAFHHQGSSFCPESRGLLSLVMSLTEGQKSQREITLSRMNRDRFFEVLEQEELEVQLPGGIRSSLKVQKKDPKLVICISKYGRDGVEAVLKGVCTEEGSVTEPVLAFFRGERRIYIVTEKTVCCCSHHFSQAAGTFLEQITRDREYKIQAGAKDIPLLYERVLKTLKPYSLMQQENVDLEEYKMEPLKAVFRFDADEKGILYMEPLLSYGEYTFHPVEDENLPSAICRDVPGEFKISQVIRKYFKYRDPKDGRLVLKEDEKALYHLLDKGMEEFRSMGDVYLSESMKNWKIMETPTVSAGVSAYTGWLELTVDMGEFPKEELGRILAAYSQKKKYYRLKSGQFLMLDKGGIFTLTKLAGELGISKKDLQSGTIRLPAYRALYLDHILKEGPGITYYRDQLFKAMVRAVKAVEDSDEPVPARFENVLREYQKMGFRWMKTLDKCGFGGILADDMGLGKTIQVIALFEDAYSSGEKAPSLVVCPASLVFNWEQEIQKFAPDLKVQSVVGTGPQRMELLQSIKEGGLGCQVLITSYDLLKRDIANYEGIDFRFQIIDEAQYIKNAATQSARSVKAVNVRSRFALTGTPIENRLGELWSIFDFLMPGFLFGNQYFRREYEIPITKERNEQALERLKGLIGPFILRRVKKDVLKELPDKLEKVVYSTLEEEQKKLYTANAILLKEKLESDDFKGAEKLQILSDLMRLRQICCDPRLCYGNYKAGSAKLKTCMDLIRTGVEGEHKILLFSQFTSMLDLIEEQLKKDGIECYKLTGATPKEERIQMVSRFHQNGVPVFLISLKAGGTGLNLTAADIVIHYDPWWNVAAQNQATDRTHRIGQEKQVMVYKLITSDTIEENILKLQEAKKDLADQIVSKGGVSFGELTKDDILKMIEESRP